MRILNSLPPYTLFGSDCKYEEAKVAVFPVPYDATLTYRPGTRDGPHAIIEASRGMEWYNEEFESRVADVGVYTMEEMEPDVNSPEGMVGRIEKEVASALQDGKFPLTLGGEHTVSLGPIRALSKANKKKFSILHFDAHSDARDSYFGSKYCHACVVARMREMCENVYSVGVRSVDEECMEEHSKEIMLMKDMEDLKDGQIAKSIIANTGDRIYMTVDLDVLNPAEMPSVGTPEPDGMSYRQLRNVIREVAKKKTIIGMDFVELSPIQGITAPNYLAAKLIYMSLGYAFQR
jgi:agmatinase